MPRSSTQRRVTMQAKNPDAGRVDRERVLAMSEAEIGRTSPKELADLPDDFWDQATIVLPTTKELISIRLDGDVLAWFRSLGTGYQSRMNAVLRSYMRHQCESHSAESRSR